MYHKIPIMAGLATLALLLVFVSGDAFADPTRADYTAMSAGELAEYLIFDANGFRLDGKTQEGGTVRDRQQQDAIQKACSFTGGGQVDGDTATRVFTLARESITYPEGGIKLGNWKDGEAVARSGFGFRVGHKVDDHGKREPGGNCYACHQLDPDEIAFGTLGPSLKNYGKARGTGEAMLKYTYEVIYNPHTFFPCTHMPRFGAHGTLTLKQIADVMAYLMHPESPVNQ